MSGRHVRPPVNPEVFDRQYEWSRLAAQARKEMSIQERVDAYIEARRRDRVMEDSEIREACIAYEETGVGIEDEVALAIAGRWPSLRGIGTVKIDGLPSLELYGSLKHEIGKRSGDFVEDINELRELRALEAWARRQGVQA